MENEEKQMGSGGFMDLDLNLGLLYTDKWGRNFNVWRFGFNQVRHRAFNQLL